VRIRIALTTAVAVIAIPILLFTLFSSSPAASARNDRHVAGVRREATRHVTKVAPVAPQGPTINTSMEPTAFRQAMKQAKLQAFYQAVEKQALENYLQKMAAEHTFLAALAAQRAQAAAQAAAAQAQARAAAAAATAQAAAPAPTASAPAPTAGGSDASSTNTADWACIRAHESGDNYSEHGGGAYQFELPTWESLTGLSSPAEDSSPAVQDAAALRLYSERGWEPWTTRYVCGL
jgi:Transglycosylase-like domain